MSYSIQGTTINLTRGDTFKCLVNIYDANGDPYEIQEGDEVRFAMKSSYAEGEPLLYIDIPTESMILTILPEQTKELAFGTYVYDIQLTTAAGEICTFITKSNVKLTEEVY